MNDEQAKQVIEELKSLNWKVWEIYNILKDNTPPPTNKTPIPNNKTFTNIIKK